eukprot:m.51658 g.51658  ORF g.51658 m.51658 type:complete len:504 (-) comp9067_c0_seq2:1873-3384(-)
MADWTTDESDQDENNPLLASSASDDDAQLLNIQGSDGGTPLPTYRLAGLGTRVWVVLSLFLLSTLQAMCWNVFAPVFSTVHAVYGWDDTEVEWLANVANIGMLCALPFTTIIVGALGPRVPTILTAMLMMLCTGLRVVPRIYTDSTGHEMDSRMVLSLNVVSMIINGASAAWLSFSGPVQSEIWFPPTHRATVTAVLSVAPYVGVSLGYIVGPLVIPEGEKGAKALNAMLLAHAICAATILLAMIIYFPTSPEIAPSRSASIRADMAAKGGSMKAVNMIRGLGQAIFGCSGDNSQSVHALWIIALAYSLPLGVQAGWGAVLAINLKKVAGIGSVMSGWIGCISTLSGCIGGIIIGAVNDRFTGSLKTFVLVSYSLSSIFFAALGLLVLKFWIPPPGTLVPLIYTSAIAGGFFLYCPIPLFYEMVVEETYPRIPAATSGGVLSILVTVVQIVFLFAPVGRWMNWAMMLITPFAIIPLLFLSIKYPRTQEDQVVHIARLDRLGFF